MNRADQARERKALHGGAYGLIAASGPHMLAREALLGTTAERLHVVDGSIMRLSALTASDASW